MTRVPPLPFQKVRRTLLKLGSEIVGQRGSHVHFRHLDGRFTQAPNHSGEDIGRGLVKSIVESVGVTLEEFLRQT